GKRVKCPKCGDVGVVPDKSDKIKFHCENCGQGIRVPQSYAGKKGSCPKCKNPIVVPSLEKPPSEGAETFSIVCPMCEETIQVPEASRGQTIECPACGSYVGDESDASVPSGADEDSYQEETEEEYEESEGVDRRLIVIISAVAGAVVVGLILLVVVLRLARPQRKEQVQEQVADTSAVLTQLELDEVQDFAERYIGLLESGQLDEALQLHSPGFGSRKSVIQRYSRQIGIRRIVEMDCQRTHCELHPEGDQILLWYSLRYERGRQAIILSAIRIGQELTIDGIATWGVSGHSISAGRKTRDALSAAADAASGNSRAVSERFDALFGKFFCGFAIGILVLCVVYIITWWIVYEKAGYPGWAAIVPFYNVWVLAEIAGYSGWLGLLMCFSGFIPYIGGLIGFIVSIIISIGVAKAFGRGVLFGLGLAFLPMIFYPILAFAKD
ncbi:MAG: DUF5684 domain-containing protein, partial [Planctomycetota bacterium]